MCNYELGFIDGLTAFAWWKDGKQFIGTTGMALSEVLTHVDLTWNFSHESETLSYKRGFADGITAFAWWKDGEQYVGTTGTKLCTVLDSMENVWNFNLPEEESV